ncbi:MAG: Hsp20/alpha crystallin family protein [Magnetococcales bacterium]|nr:Hsp20/alpha crystallin family protein [Magnetococcales bacterium]
MFSLSPGIFAGCGADLAGPVWDMWVRSSGMAKPSNHWGVATDVTETEDVLTLSIDVPGIDPKELHVSVEPGRLEIRGTRISHHKGRRGRAEWEGRAFLHAFYLPDGLKLAQAGASAKNGVLKVTIPKTKETRSRRIPVDGIQLTPPPSDGVRVPLQQTGEGWLNRAKSFVSGLFVKRLLPVFKRGT